MPSPRAMAASSAVPPHRGSSINGRQRRQRTRCAAASNSSSSPAGPRATPQVRAAELPPCCAAPLPQQHPSPYLQGFGSFVNAGLVSGSLTLAGDLVAQLLAARGSNGGGGGSPPLAFDAARAARMGSFGLLLYGPGQLVWYRALDSAFAGRSLRNFAIKVVLNQVGAGCPCHTYATLSATGAVRSKWCGTWWLLTAQHHD